MEKDTAKAAKRAENEATAATAKAVMQQKKVEQVALKAAEKADNAAKLAIVKAAAKAEKLVEKQTDKDSAAAELTADAPFVWNEAELQRYWNEDRPAYYLWGLRQSREPIDDGNDVICRALGCWYQAMQHTKATQIKADLQNMKERLWPADIQLLLKVHPDTLRRSMSASPATKHAA